MSSERFEIHISDDWLLCSALKLNHVHAISEAIGGCDYWLEIVPGIDSLAVQFDPATISPDSAALKFQAQLANSPTKIPGSKKELRIPICYEAAFAPDRDWLAQRFEIPVSDLAEWHSSLDYSVSILGFMPGFAYLKADQDVLKVGRLSIPRQRVEAGSVGIIGKESCLYSLDGPGGWPLIGRTPIKLFSAGTKKPSLVGAGDRVKFHPISSAEFSGIAGRVAE